MAKEVSRPRHGSLGFINNTSRKKQIPSVLTKTQVYYMKVGMDTFYSKREKKYVPVTILKKIDATQKDDKKIDLNFKSSGIRRKNTLRECRLNLEDKPFYTVTACTKGEGTIGPVEKHGLPLQKRNSSKNRRGVGSMGLRRPGYVTYKKPFAGRWGGNRRTYYNYENLYKGIGNYVNETFKLVNCQLLALKGSIPGKKYTVVAVR